MVFLLGYTFPPKSMVAYSHLMEFLPGRECKISGVLMFIDGSILVISPIILLYLTKDLDNLFIIALALNVTAFLLFIILRIPESLKSLLQRGHYISFSNELKKVQRLGGISNNAIKKTENLANLYQ